MNALVEQKAGALAPTDQRMAVAEVLAHAQTIQQVLAQAMKEGVDFGTIPGTDKPTLLQPGADKLAMTFRIAHEFSTEDLGTPDCARYRVKCVGRHQMTGIVLGEGMGECSGAEEKYRWRRAVCDDEYEEAPANLRRIKFAKSKGQVYRNKQVRTEPADAANTVLKMAVKRAKIAMVLNVTGASAVFGQDLEDLAPELREAFDGKVTGAAAEVKPLTPEQLAEWEAASRKGRKAGRTFWSAWPQSLRDGATEEQKQRMWSIAEAADATPAQTAVAHAPSGAAPAEAPPPPAADDDFVAAMNAAETAAATEGAAGA